MKLLLLTRMKPLKYYESRYKDKMVENISKEALTILIAASPIIELRGAIPAAVLEWNFPAEKAFVLGVFGNFLPVIPLLLFWNYLAEWLSHRIYFFNRLFNWLFEKTRSRHNHHFEIWKGLALLIFVAIPLPFTGAWSATIAAFVFGIPLRRAAIMIFLGILISGLIVLSLSIAGTFVI